MKIATTEQMREMDQQTIQNYEVPGLILMENAALQFIEVLKERFGPLNEKRIVIICGKGNNGGDGLAIARHLSHYSGANVQIVLIEAADAFRGQALANFKMAVNYQIKIQSSKDLNFKNFDLIIDAIFGIGFKGSINESTAQIIEKINSSGLTVASVDVPSGLDSDTGMITGSAIKAKLTVTFGLAKYGQLVYPGADFVGELVIVDIGYPKDVLEAAEIKTFATDSKDIKSWLTPRKNGRDTNKGTYGHVMVFAGSRGFVGAPILVAEAAQRAGAGLVTLAIPAELESLITSRVSQVIMTRGLSQARDTSFNVLAVEEALALIQKASAVVIGPGIGLGEEVTKFVLEFIARCPVPLVIDADALTILSKSPDRGESLIKNRKAATALTPHPQEMGRLLGMTTEAIQDYRRYAINHAIKIYNCVVLLKGSRTLISDSSGRVYLNTTGNPGLSSGGTGDALAGIIAGFLAQKLEALPAAAAAAFIHGTACDMVAKKNKGYIGINAIDIISYLPRAIAQSLKNE